MRTDSWPDKSSARRSAEHADRDARAGALYLDGSKRNSFRKGLPEEFVGEVANLLVGSWDVERQYDAVMSPSTLRLFKLLWSRNTLAISPSFRQVSGDGFPSFCFR